jgi:F-type H+-transporting ATPase subunit epsilon
LGAFQVLNNHAPIVSALAKGAISFTGSEGKQSIQVAGGVVEVKQNTIVVLAEKVFD